MENREGIMTFYQWMQRYPHKDQERIALAKHMKELGKRHTEVKKIKSFMDLMQVATYMTDGEAFRAVSGSLWCEYCTACGREISF